MAKIKSIEYFRVLPRWLFVKVCDNEGNSGWGESTLEGHSEAVEGTLNALIKRYVGYEAEYVQKTPTPVSFDSITATDAIFQVISSISGKAHGDTVSTEAARCSCLPSQVSTLRCGTSKVAIFSLLSYLEWHPVPS
jgi:hypothetical protein